MVRDSIQKYSITVIILTQSIVMCIYDCMWNSTARLLINRLLSIYADKMPSATYIFISKLNSNTLCRDLHSSCTDMLRFFQIVNSDLNTVHSLAHTKARAHARLHAHTDTCLRAHVHTCTIHRNRPLNGKNSLFRTRLFVVMAISNI